MKKLGQRTGALFLNSTKGGNGMNIYLNSRKTRFLGALLLPLIVQGCGTNATPKSEKYQMEMTLHKTRIDLEELKHDLHTQKMEINILEGKMVNQEDLMTSIKKDTFEVHQAKLDAFVKQLSSMEKKLVGLETKQEEGAKNLQKLLQASTEMGKAIAQSKERINEMERTLTLQSKSGQDVAKLKKEVDRVAKALEQTGRCLVVDTYRVKLGDTLVSIAEEYSTNLETLQKINRLDTEKVVVGQELLVPYTIEP